MDILKKNLKFIGIGLLTGIINGLFGSGGGTIIVPALIFLVGLEDHKSHATAISIILPLSIISTIIYVRHGVIKFDIAMWVAFGGVVGGFLGAKLLTKVPSKILRKVFGVFMMAAAVRMVMG